MNKSLAASQGLMKNYLSELLTEDFEEPLLKEDELNNAEETQKLNKLLQHVNVTEQYTHKVNNKTFEDEHENLDVEPKFLELLPEKTKLLEPRLTDTILAKTELNSPEPILATKKSLGELPTAHSNNYRDSSFQAMFFNVAGLVIAVPLVELGGIHNLDTTTSLVGKPAWFKGVMLHRDEKINIVDTAQWVMPEKCDDKLKDALDYQYVIMLSNSKWGLLAENLVDTVTLEPEDVKWLDSSSKRPWLSGLVKDRMCALLDVEALIKLLNDGIDIRQI